MSATSPVLLTPDQGTTCNWTIDFADIAIVSGDGSVFSLYNGQNISFSSNYTGGGGMYNLQPAALLTPAIAGTPGATRYYVADQVGTAQLELSQDGWPIWKGEFAPFGQQLDQNQTTNRYKFTGKERDAESGLDYFGARYYGSNMGRFMSPDPTGGKLEDPQSLNRYAYVRNNPLSFTDPTGLNFGLPCSGGNTDTCNNGLQGSWQHDADGNKTSFTNISIGNKDGQLQDVSSNNSGSYTASFDGENVSLTNSAGATQNGSWLQGTADVKGVSGGGDLSSKFMFNFSDHGDGQKVHVRHQKSTPCM